ncbi:MAG TPA: hypothetical protein DGR97_14050 [Gammaproteobacteria bacterium]|nr:hypothetical protein [Gammaproteobacteria bacterium]|tara:strand:- start:44 stop:691 length:648 start_codon:yes stop_codon:yes gene_type:complete
MARQSPLLPLYSAPDFEIGESNGTRIALRTKKKKEWDDYVADLSALRRRLFVGPAVPEWLANHNISAPQGLLKYNNLEKGAVIVRLHRQQYLLIDSVEGSSYDDVFSIEQRRHDGILVIAYEAAEIACGGPHVEDLIAELCPMNVAINEPNSWIATRFAHCELAIRHLAEPSHYRILCSPADARFVFEILFEVTLERDGVALGFNDYRALINLGD